MPKWVALLLDDLDTCMSIELTDLIIGPPGESGGDAPAPRGRGLKAFARCDERLFGRRLDFLAPADLGDWASSHGIELSTATAALATTLEPSDHLSAEGPDIVLDLTEGNGCLLAAKGACGEVWWTKGVPTRVGRVHVDLPGVVTGALRGSQVTAFELCARTSGCDGSVVLVTGFCPTHPTSPLMTGDCLAASARQLIFEKLKASSLRRISPSLEEPAGDQGRGTASPDVTAKGRVSRPASARRPTAGIGLCTTGAYFVRTAKRQARRAVLEKQWHLLVGEQRPDQQAPDPSCLQPLVPEPGYYWADPFAVVYEGQTHLFFEEFVYDSRRGRIAAITLDGQGRPGRKAVALELDSHLSYPCIFTHEGRVYMVPESADRGTVELYECMDMPDKWVRRRTVVSGVQLVDASLVEWRGLWWMFASLKKPAGLRTAELLMLYMSENPVTGTWRQHPSNPLLADVTNARPAGAPFVLGEKLYRPAQDGSGGYGWAIALNEVLSLTPDSYLDRRVTTVRPDWSRAVCGTHTLNRAGNTVVMDACRYMLRDPRRPRADSLLD